MLDFQKFIEWTFLAVIGGGVAWSASFLSKISDSVTELNIKLATVLERSEWHGKELEDYSSRIIALERHKKA